MKSFFSGHRRLALRGLVVATALSVMPAAAAHASIISVSPCDGASLTQPFLKSGDSAPYKLVPGGDFETNAKGWSLTGGAQVVPGSEPVRCDGLGREVLALPPRRRQRPVAVHMRRRRLSILPLLRSQPRAALDDARPGRIQAAAAGQRGAAGRRGAPRTRPGAHRCRCSPLRPYRVSWAEATPRLLFASRR